MSTLGEGWVPRENSLADDRQLTTPMTSEAGIVNTNSRKRVKTSFHVDIRSHPLNGDYNDVGSEDRRVFHHRTDVVHWKYILEIPELKFDVLHRRQKMRKHAQVQSKPKYT
jgi:hypothetical protein